MPRSEARGPESRAEESPFLLACRRQKVPCTPVWYMRQAGRSLPEYRALRTDRKMLDALTNPDLITEITLQPVRRYEVDAAIFFSDIVVPLRAIGIGIDLRPGVGPVVERPMRTAADIARLRPLVPEDVPYVAKSVAALVGELAGKPLIGFAGGPFTLACYLVEGGPSKNFERTKALLYGAPQLWADLMSRLADITIAFLEVQVAAGASAIQLFDSWAGALSLDDYRANVLPYSRRVFTALAGTGVPRLPMSWEWTGGCRSTRRSAGLSRGRRCRATSIRPSCWRHGRSSSAGRARYWIAAGRPRVTSSISATACCRIRIRMCWPG